MPDPIGGPCPAPQKVVNNAACTTDGVKCPNVNDDSCVCTGGRWGC